MKKGYIEIGKRDKTVFIKIIGRADFQISPSLKNFIHQCLEQKFRSFAINMKDCTTMDSTFMGVIAGTSGILRERGITKLTLYNITDHNFNLLETLGISLFLNFAKKPPEEPAKYSSLILNILSQREMAENVLNAHTSLIEISEGNKVKFKDVVEYLKEDLKKKKSSDKNRS
ncbi:MAG: STAS domain-containing protein [Candidatus Theseobacter exili]|nr:STAS domain-containing protein [Candidatus Theseobacter exili]